MHVVQISNPEVFAAKAKDLGLSVTTCMNTAVEFIDQGGSVKVQPALRFDYQIQFKELHLGETLTTRWTFREVRLADEESVVSLEGTLRQRLQQLGIRMVELHHQ